MAQETIEQFNAANAENRRHMAAETQLRNEARQLRSDQLQGLVACQGAGVAAACRNGLEQHIQQRGLMLDNRARNERDAHRANLQTIGVNPY